MTAGARTMKDRRSCVYVGGWEDSWRRQSVAAWAKRSVTKGNKNRPGREGLRRTSRGFRRRKQQRVWSFWYKVFNVTLYKQDYNSQRVSTVLKGRFAGGCFRAGLALSPLLSAALATVQCELMSLLALTYL